MWFALAKKIGGTTVEELKRRMTHIEFLRWKKELEEEIHERDEKDWQIAVVAYEVYVLRHVLSHLFAKTIPPVKHKIEDFLVKFEKTGEKTKRTLPEMEAMAMVKSTKAHSIIKATVPTPLTKGRVKRRKSNGP